MNAIDRVTMFALVKAAPKEHRTAILKAMAGETQAKLRKTGKARYRFPRRVARRRVALRRLRSTAYQTADPPPEPPSPSDGAHSSGGLA